MCLLRLCSTFNAGASSFLAFAVPVQRILSFRSACGANLQDLQRLCSRSAAFAAPVQPNFCICSACAIKAAFAAPVQQIGELSLEGFEVAPSPVSAAHKFSSICNACAAKLCVFAAPVQHLQYLQCLCSELSAFVAHV